MRLDPPAPPVPRLKRARAFRRLALAALAAFVVLGGLGVFGVRTAEVTARGGGYELTVTYASVTRPGLATPWSVEVRHAEGFDEPITLRVTEDYLAMFDENGLDPDPASATADAEFVQWSFDPPSGDTLAVSFDARIEPAQQWGRRGEVVVMIGERRVVEASFKTWVMP